MGVRYMSPAWSVSTSWAGCPASRRPERADSGRIRARGRPRDERLGMMIDVSPRPDKNLLGHHRDFDEAVIATHSNARAITDVPRNLADEQIRALAKTGGVVCVVFYPAFVEPGWDEQKRRVDAEIAPLVEAASRGVAAGGPGSLKRIARDRVREREYLRRMPPVSVARVVDHIDHIVRSSAWIHVGIAPTSDGIQAVPRDWRASPIFQT